MGNIFSEREGGDGGGGLGEEREEEEELGLEEVERAIRKLKKRKAAREDGIQNKAWLWGGGKAIGEICRRVWDGEGFPERWKDGVIVPIAKKRGAERVEDHRGVTLMPTAYKIYAMVLAERLRGEVIDNIYTLNYVVERKLAKGKRMATFVNLRTVFDSVDKGSFGKEFRGEGSKCQIKEEDYGNI